MAVELWFDPETGKSEVVEPSGSAPEGRWRITCEGDAISIQGDTGRGEYRAIGWGRWSGKGVAERQTLDAPIDDSTWGRIEHALRRVLPEPAEEKGKYVEIIVDLSTGVIVHRRRKQTERRPANAFEWKVVITDGNEVIVHAADRMAIGRATWDGQQLIGRKAGSKRHSINDYQWGVVENAVSEVLVGRAAPGAAARVAAASSAGTAAEVAPGADARSRAVRDRRSAWWALAAIGLALAGTIVSWSLTPPGDSVGLGVTIALGAVTLGLGIYAGIGVGTRCPRCHAWYRRQTTATTEVGGSTYTKQISEPVRDSSGKQIGTTTVSATYQSTTYRHDYLCKECQHRWTGTSTTERRLS